MKKRYWLRGGTVAIVIDAMLVALILVTTSSKDELGLIFPLSFLQIPFTGFVYIFKLHSLESVGVTIVGGLICWFIVGSIIGWLIRKIMSRNSMVSQ